MYVFSEVLAVVAELYTFHLFMLGTFYKRDKPLSAWLGAYGLFGLILTLLSFLVNASYIRLLFCVIAMTCVGISLFEAKPLQSIYASLSFGCLYVLTDVLTIVAFSIANIDVQTIMSYGIARSVCITISHTVLLALVLIVLVLTRKKRSAITFPFLLAISPGCIAGIILGLFFCKSAQSSGSDLHFSFIIAAAGLLYLNILIVFYAEQKEESCQRQYELELADHHYMMQEHYYAQLHEEQNETRAMFHDINKYLQAMRALVNGANSEAATHVLLEAQALYNGLVSVVDVGNPVISIILNEYKTIIEEKEISFSYDVSVPKELNVSAVDAYVILGNTLDNAIAACIDLPKHERYIHLQLRVYRNIIYYQLQNPFLPDERKHTKGKNHGFGLQNVRRCVEKHKGEMIITKENGIFTLDLRINS